jgi:competence protein ComEA
MVRPRRLLWLVLIAGISYTIWRWRQRQANDRIAPALSPTPPSPAREMASAGAAPTDAPAPPSGPRRIITRVHRGAPPATPLSPAPAAAPAAAPEEPPPAPSQPPATHEQSLAPLTPEEAVEAPAEAEPPATHEQSLAPLTPEEAVEAPAEPLGAPDEPDGVGLVNINSADRQTLIDLPGIGPALADRIIAHRDAHGAFASVEELVDIQGIGAVSLSEFRHRITV